MMTDRNSLVPEIGPDGLAREAPVIAYTEKIIAAEQLQLRKYIDENYTKIRDVERELASLSFEMKLTAGPKKAALELLRKKIETSTERIHVAKVNEEQARKAWEAASKVVKDEEEVKQKLCDDLNNLVQESSASQFTRLEELKRRLEAMNPNRASTSIPHTCGELREGLLVFGDTVDVAVITPIQTSGTPRKTEPNGLHGNNISNQGNGESIPIVNVQNEPCPSEGDGRGKKKNQMQGRGKGIGAVPKGRGPGWTGAGFDVDGRT